MNWEKRENIHISKLDEDTLEELDLYVGQNYDFFKEKWKKIKPDSTFKISWNWASFFFGLSYYAFRKMYRLAYLYLGIIILGEFLLFYLIKTGIPFGSLVLLHVVIALTANSNYQVHAIKHVINLKNLYPNRDERLEIIKIQGRTSWLGALVFVLVFIIFTFLLGLWALYLGIG